MDEEQIKQTDWNLKQDIGKMISFNMWKAQNYATGNYPVPRDHIATPHYINQTLCWKEIETLIKNRLSKEQKVELIRLKKELHQKTWVKNPKCKSMYNQPKMIVENGLMGKYNRKYIDYVYYLIGKLGLGMGDKDSWEGDF